MDCNVARTKKCIFELRIFIEVPLCDPTLRDDLKWAIVGMVDLKEHSNQMFMYFRVKYLNYFVEQAAEVMRCIN